MNEFGSTFKELTPPSDQKSNSLELMDIKSKYESLRLKYKSLSEQIRNKDSATIKEKDFIITNLKEENKDWRNKVDFFYHELKKVKEELRSNYSNKETDQQESHDLKNKIRI